MASPRDLTGVLRWWSADAPAELDGGRVVAAPDVVAGAAATRFGQGRVGPELLQVDGRPAWRFGGSASPASLLTPDVPAISGAPYAWVIVLAPLTGYAGQVLAPGPNTAVTSSSAQLLAGTTGSFRWEAFAGATTSLPMPGGEHLVVLEHDGGTGSTRLYATGQGSVRATLQRRSLAGQQHIGRHGSNDRPLHADVRGILLLDHGPSDAEVAHLEQWRTEGASSRSTATVTVTLTARVRTAATTASRRDVATSAPSRARVDAATAARRDVAVTTRARAPLGVAAAPARNITTTALARARLAALAAARRDVDVVAPARARLSAPATGARAVAVQLRALARLVVDVDSARDVDLDVLVPAVAPLQVAVAARREVTHRVGALARLQVTAAARRDVATRVGALGRLNVSVAASRDVHAHATALARLGVVAGASRAVDVLAGAAARLAVLVELVRPRPPVPTSTDGDLVASIGPPAPAAQVGGPAARWAVTDPAPAWVVGPPTHQRGGGR